MRNKRRPLTVVVERPDGDPKYVESMIMKASPSSKTGLGVTRTIPLSVSSIQQQSLFASSLLSPMDRILSINGNDCTRLNPSEAASLITDAPSTVTIVAKKGFHNAAIVTLAEGACR